MLTNPVWSFSGRTAVDFASMLNESQMETFFDFIEVVTLDDNSFINWI